MARRRIWGALARTCYSAGRLERLLERLGVSEDTLTPGCGHERVGITLYLTPEENVTLERMSGFYGLSRSQLGRACVVALLGEHHERMQWAEELGYALKPRVPHRSRTRIPMMD